MNQILSIENTQKKHANNELLDMRRIMIIFSILVVVLAAIIIGVKVVGMIKEKSKNGPAKLLNIPNIEIEPLNGSLCQINVEYDEGIDTVTYWWNNEEVMSDNKNGAENYNTTLSIPQGDYNTLHIKVRGIDGSENETKKEFVSEEIANPEKPKIHFEYTSKETIVTIESVTGLKKVSYYWEEEENTEIELNGEKTYTFNLENRRGTNRLYIEATDLENNVKNKAQNIIGVLAPEFDIYIENNEILVVKVSHDKGFKKVIIKINDQECIYDESNPAYSESITLLKTDCPLTPGRLDVNVTVYTLEEPEKAYVESRYADIQ